MIRIRNLPNSKFPPIDLKLLTKDPKKIARGVKAINALWEKGYKPEDLEHHFYLTWIAFSNAKNAVLAKLAGFHRNKVIYTVARMPHHFSIYQFRSFWLQAVKDHPKGPFLARYETFFKLAKGTPVVGHKFHEVLVPLWLMGFPLKVLLPHHVLWALRRGDYEMKVSKTLRIEYRTFQRIRSRASKKGSLESYWLAPLTPRHEEWLFHWRRGNRGPDGHKRRRRY